jgi:hypothetical protein
MKRKVNRRPSKIAIFGKNGILVAMFSSQTQAARLLGVSTSTVNYASRGFTSNCQGWYMRELKNVEPETKDFGTLTLDDFDTLNGERRRFVRKTNKPPTISATGCC